MSISNNRDFEQLKAKLPVMTFLQKYLPDGKKIGNEWVALNPTREDTKAGSFKVNTDECVWCDFATGDKGSDLISLYAYLNRCSQAQAYDNLSNIYHHAKPIPQTKAKKERKIYTGIDDFPEAEDLWVYYDYDGKFLGYVIRCKKRDLKGKKIFMPFIEQSPGEWISTWWPSDYKPIYRIDQLKIHPDKPLLIVEGEKTTDKAQKLFPEYVVITWMGGTSNADKADITHLKDRICFLWPDNDLAGIEAMHVLDKRLNKHAKITKVINVASLGLTPKWDLADYDAAKIDINILKADLLMEEKKSTSINIYDFPDISEKGKALNTTDNIAYLINHFEIKIRYNLMTNSAEFSAENKNFNMINKANCFFIEISNLCVKNNVPKIDLYDHINLIAEKNCYHPAIEFIESKSWDGVSRLNDLFDTITSPKQDLANKLIYRWLISCVAALYLPEGIASEGALVLQGKQKVGKTYWFIKLLPKAFQHLVKEGVSISVNNKDDLIKATNVWIAELGEIQSTFKKSDVDELKNFITRSYDEYREPFGRFPKKCGRRTIFVGSVNSEKFLADETGNRRFWTIPVTTINYEHTIDMQQVWAEVKILYDKGESYRLTFEEHELLNESNKDHECINPLKEIMLNNYYWESLNKRWMVPTNILIELGQPIDKSKTNNLANVLREMDIRSRNSKRGTEYEIPYLKSPHTNN